MQITVNGEQKNYAEDQLNIAMVLAEQQVESPEMVAVQLNGAFVDKEEFDRRRLNEGDNLEFLYFMGGGAA